MKPPPAAVASTVTSVAGVMATDAQTRLPRATRQPPNRLRGSEGWFPTEKPSSSRPLPIGAASTDASALMRASRRAASEPAYPHCDTRNISTVPATTRQGDLEDNRPPSIKAATDTASHQSSSDRQVPAWQVIRDKTNTILSRFGIFPSIIKSSRPKEDDNEDQN